MSNTNKKKPIAFKDASAALVKKVEGVIAEAKKHQYSVSRVFAAYNEVFNLNEVPQTCASCLRTRAEKLASWYQPVKQLIPDAPAGDAVVVTVDEFGQLSGTPAFPVTYIIVDNEEHFAVEEDGKTISHVVFTPAEEGAQYGIAIDGRTGEPAPIGVYKQDEKAFAVGGVFGEYTEVTGEPVADTNADKFLQATDAHFAKLAELGVTDESTDAELLEALLLLSTDENATDEERAFIAARIEGVQDKIAAATLTVDGQVHNLHDGVTVLTFKDETAQAVHFTTDDKSVAVVGSKGTVKNADGSNVKTGTHDLANGTKLAVAVGGRATIK